jgi:hypothetical protein
MGNGLVLEMRNLLVVWPPSSLRFLAPGSISCLSRAFIPTSVAIRFQIECSRSCFIRRRWHTSLSLGTKTSFNTPQDWRAPPVTFEDLKIPHLGLPLMVNDRPTLR